MSVNSSRWTSEMIIYGGEKAIVIVPVFMLPILHSVCLAWRYTALVLIGFAAYWGACGSTQAIPQYCNLLLLKSSLGLCAWWKRTIRSVKALFQSFQVARPTHLPEGCCRSRQSRRSLHYWTDRSKPCMHISGTTWG
jgi:hypothetical protein